MSENKKGKGFSLAEVLVCFIILALMTGISYPLLSSKEVKAKDYKFRISYEKAYKIVDLYVNSYRGEKLWQDKDEFSINPYYTNSLNGEIEKHFETVRIGPYFWGYSNPYSNNRSIWNNKNLLPDKKQCDQPTLFITNNEKYLYNNKFNIEHLIGTFFVIIKEKSNQIELYAIDKNGNKVKYHLFKLK